MTKVVLTFKSVLIDVMQWICPFCGAENNEEEGVELDETVKCRMCEELCEPTEYDM